MTTTMTTTTTTPSYSNVFADNSDNDDDDKELVRTVEKQLGLFSRPFYDDDDDDDSDHTFLGCVRYSSSTPTTTSKMEGTKRKDTKFRTGQAFGLITVLLLTVSSIVSSCIVILDFGLPKIISRRTPFWWRVAHYISITAAITQLFTFIAVGSSEKCYNDSSLYSTGGCSISGTAKLAIFNTLLLDGICLLWFFVTMPDTPLLQVRRHVSSIPTESKDSQEQMSDKSDELIDVHPNDQTLYSKYTGENFDDTESIISDCTTAPELNIIVETTQPHDTTISISGTKKLSSSSSCAGTPKLLNLQRYKWQHQVTTVLLIVIVWIVSILGVNRCTLVFAIETVTNDDDYDDDDNSNNIAQQQQQYRSGIGLYQMAIHDDEQNFLGCVAYPSHTIHDMFDSQFRTARAFGAITTLVTSSILVLSILQLFATSNIPKISLMNKILLPFAIVTEAATFTILRSEICNIDGIVACRLGGTGKLLILNVFLLAVIYVLMSISPLPEEPLLKVVINENLENLRSIISSVSTETFCEAWSNFRISNRKVFCRNEANNTDDQISTDSSRTNINVDDPSDLNVTSIVIQVEYSDTGKTTRKIITYQDGTQTIHTTIEEMYEDDDDDETAELEPNDIVEYLE